MRDDGLEAVYAAVAELACRCDELRALQSWLDRPDTRLADLKINEPERGRSIARISERVRHLEHAIMLLRRAARGEIGAGPLLKVTHTSLLSSGAEATDYVDWTGKALGPARSTAAASPPDDEDESPAPTVSGPAHPNNVRALSRAVEGVGPRDLAPASSSSGVAGASASERRAQDDAS